LFLSVLLSTTTWREFSFRPKKNKKNLQVGSVSLSPCFSVCLPMMLKQMLLPLYTLHNAAVFPVDWCQVSARSSTV
jgi:hypothetical protein